MPYAPLADAPTFTHAGITFRPLAVPSRGSREVAVWRTELPPGATSEPHSMSREEVFVVVQGRISGEVDGQPLEAGTGDAVIVPAGALLVLRNAGDSPAVVTAVTSVGMQATVPTPDGGRATFAPPWAQ